MSTYICVLDFEATCGGNLKKIHDREIIQFPSILYEVTTNNKVLHISDFNEYVKPELHPILTKFCTELTGITQQTVNEADTFVNVYRRHHEWLLENVPDFDNFFFLTCGQWDLAEMLPCQVRRHPRIKLYSCYKKYCDIKKDFGKFYKIKSGGLATMLRILQIKLEGKHHNGFDDCKNTAKIMIKMVTDCYSDFILFYA